MKKIFTLSDQKKFSELSHDFNPIHLEKEWAEKEYPGKIVVYGISVLLWALEFSNHPRNISRIKTKFIQPILINDIVRLKTNLNEDNQVFLIYVKDKLVAKIQCFYGNQDLLEYLDNNTKNNISNIPRELSYEEIANDKGLIFTPLNTDEVILAYPKICKYTGITGVRALLSLSRLVGMYCPGLRSIFSGFDIIFEENNHELSYKVNSINKSLGFTKIDVFGLNIKGNVDCYFTEKYIDEPFPINFSIKNNYSKSNALIIGNSGLGKIASYILTSNGANVIVTSRQKPTSYPFDSNLLNTSSKLKLLELDVSNSSSINLFLNKIRTPIKSLYYFPTPRIFRRRLSLVSKTDMDEFLNIYVYKYIKFVELLMDKGKCVKNLSIGYPSSIAVDEKLPDQFEYYTSKLIGEHACELLSSRFKEISIFIERFPRLNTKQTNSFIKVKTENKIDTISKFIYKLEKEINKP